MLRRLHAGLDVLVVASTFGVVVGRAHHSSRRVGSYARLMSYFRPGSPELCRTSLRGPHHLASWPLARCGMKVPPSHPSRSNTWCISALLYLYLHPLLARTCTSLHSTPLLPSSLSPLQHSSTSACPKTTPTTFAGWKPTNTHAVSRFIQIRSGWDCWV